MVTSVPKKDNAVTLRFGYGLNTRASEDEIDPRECADGQNFALDLDNRELRNRSPFDLAATTPNAGSVDGFAQLVKADGTKSVLVQSGTNVYLWGAGGAFTQVGTVASGTKLRGTLDSNWNLGDKVIIADVAGINPLTEWDGTTFKNVAHNLTGNFIARYCFVQNERAFYGNVISNASPTPHMIVGSKLDDYTNLSVSDRPSSALGTGDPFFLLTPDLKPINGIVSAFGVTVFSSEKGRLFILSGQDSTNYAIAPLYQDSAATGHESVAYIGSDIAYGRQGRLESVIATQNFGDVETNDISRMIADQVASFDGWIVVFNKRLQRVYFFPSGQSQVWMLQKGIRDQEISFSSARALQGQSAKSPWSRWTTNHPFAFMPTCAMSLYSPDDGLEYVFMGDANGNIFRLEGFGTGGDGGTTSIDVTRTSPLFAMPLNAEAFNVEGWIKYRRSDAFTVMISLLWAGITVWNETINIDAPAISGRPVYSGGLHYSDGTGYAAPFSGRFVREPFAVPGKSNEFQVKVEVSTKLDFRIAEIGLRFEAAS